MRSKTVVEIDPPLAAKLRSKANKSDVSLARLVNHYLEQKLENELAIAMYCNFVNELEDKMQIAWDIKKEFHYSKSSGEWFWIDKGEEWVNKVGPFPTFMDALNDAVGPYLEDSE